MNGTRERSFGADPDASAHDLMNDATEVLQHARGLASLLANLIHESDARDRKGMVSAWEAIEILTYIGVQCAAQGHAKMVWQQAPSGQSDFSRGGP